MTTTPATSRPALLIRYPNARSQRGWVDGRLAASDGSAGDDDLFVRD